MLTHMVRQFCGLMLSVWLQEPMLEIDGDIVEDATRLRRANDTMHIKLNELEAVI